VGGLAVEQKYDQHFVKLYVTVITQLQLILPRTVKVAEAYANGSDDEQAYIQNLAIFLTQFFKHHITLLETTGEFRAQLLIGLEYLLNISYTAGAQGAGCRVQGAGLGARGSGLRARGSGLGAQAQGLESRV
jgi:hypothetical protein